MLESKADSITSFELALIPGLLQTGEYTQAVFVEMGVIPAREFGDTMVSRMQRQSTLLRRDPPKLLGVEGHFVVIHRLGLSPVVYVENLTAGFFVEDGTEVEMYESTVQRLLDRALGEEESASLVASLANRLDTEESDGWSPSAYRP